MATNKGSLSQSAAHCRVRLHAFASSLVSSNRHAQVYRLAPLGARRASEASYCFKVLRIDEASLAQHEAVLQRMPRLKAGYRPHDLPMPPLVSFGRLDSSPGEGRQTLWIATPWVEGIPLSRLMDGAARRRRPLRFADALMIARSIAQNIVGLGCLEGAAARLVHGDLKPANIIVASRSLAHSVLVDFDTACFEGDARPPLCGTLGYAAPEGFSAYRPEARIDAARDVYSFGVILHELLTGRGPRPLSPGSAQRRRHRLAVAEGVYGPRIDESLPADARDLVASCLAPHPADRPRPDALLKATSYLVERYKGSGLRCGCSARMHDLPTLLCG